MRHGFAKKAAKIAAAVIAGLFVFALGMRAGEIRANFSYRWAEQYNRNFGGESVPAVIPEGIRPQLPGRFLNGHGVYGEVLNVDGNRLLVKDGDGNEKLIVISPRTTLRRGDGNIMPRDINPDERIVVIGSPNSDGQIDARMIRVFPIDGALIKRYHPWFTGHSCPAPVQDLGPAIRG